MNHKHYLIGQNSCGEYLKEDCSGDQAFIIEENSSQRQIFDRGYSGQGNGLGEDLDEDNTNFNFWDML